MTVTGVGPQSSLIVRALGDMRTQLGDLQRQLGTGKKSTSYAGLGIERGLAVSLRGRLSAMDSYADTVTQIGVRMSVQQSALGRIAELGRTVKAGTLGPYSIDSSGQTTTQRAAVSQLDEILGLLNTPAGDRYLFSGRAGDKPATDTLDHILNGDGAKAGLRQIIAERNQADLGANGLGRLAIPPAAGSAVSISEETPATVFGMKLASVSALNGATVTGPTGSPASIGVNFTGTPNPGDAITFSFTLPDGTTQPLKLTATNSAPPAAGEFTIGANPNATAANLQASLTTAVGKLAATSLSAASAMAAADNFFNVGAGQPPLRVSGSPFTATALTAGTAANTVTWYTGEMGTDAARGTAVAKVDDALSVAYGARANEQAIRSTIASVAVFASMTFSPSDPNAKDRFDDMKQRVAGNLGTPPAGQQKIEDIQAELAFAQTTAEGATQRQQQRKATLENLLQGIEQAPPEEVAAQILALQTRLQASLQTTSMLYQLSIVNYI